MADTATTDIAHDRAAYGWAVGPSTYGPRGIVARPERTSAGNVVLRAGNANEPAGSGWTQSVYIVLTPAEASDLRASLSPVTVWSEPTTNEPTTNDVIVCDGCGKTTTDGDKWDPEVGTGRVLCGRCWYRREV